MNIWILQTGEPLHCDEGNYRPMRAMNIANALIAAGHHVVLWSSAFYHQEKRHRCRVAETIHISPQLEIRLIPSPGYQRNVGLGRLWDHAVLSFNLKRQLQHETTLPDVAFIGYPPIEVAAVMTRWLTIRGIPSLLDAKDQWPHIFIEPFPKFIRPIARLALFPYFFFGRKAMREATAYCSMTQSFLEWMGDYSGRPLSSLDCVAPLSPTYQGVSDIDLKEAFNWWRERNVIDDGRRRFFFVGTFSRAFDFGPVVEAASLAYNKGLDWQFVLCGDGEQFKYLAANLADLPNVVLPGWVDRPKVEALAHLSVLGLAPYRNTPDFLKSIPNKIIDYLSFGIPIASSLDGEVASLIQRNRIGVVYGQPNSLDLFSCLLNICKDDAGLSALSDNAKDIYDKHFLGEKVYQSLAEKLVSLPKRMCMHD